MLPYQSMLLTREDAAPPCRTRSPIGKLRAHVKDPLQLRTALVQHALTYGVKPAARAFGTTPQTVRLWLGRYRREGLTGLKERSRRPQKVHPQKTSVTVERRVVALRRADPTAGQDRIAALLADEDIVISGKTVGKILHKHHLIAVYKDSEVKRGLPQRRLLPFAEVQLDVCDLYDACNCCSQIDHGVLPRYGFALRDVATGAGFVAYAKVLDAHAVLCFVERVLRHLHAFSLKPRVLHTLDGSEGFRRQLDRALVGLLLERGIVPNLLPPGEAAAASSVTTFNRLLEREFYRNAAFADEPDLLAKAWAFERWFNLERRDHRRRYSPFELSQRHLPELTPQALEFEPICLDHCIC